MFSFIKCLLGHNDKISRVVIGGVLHEITCKTCGRKRWINNQNLTSGPLTRDIKLKHDFMIQYIQLERERKQREKQKLNQKKVTVISNWATILGVSETATATEVKAAYRKKVMAHHPDRGGDANKFNEIQQAYDFYVKLTAK